MNIDHVDLINEISHYPDISEKVVSYIDIKYLEKIHRRRCQERDSIKKKRWRRSSNHYDTLYYNDVLIP